MLHNFELRTSKIVSREDLDTGTLADEFIDADYQLNEAVRSYPFTFYWNRVLEFFFPSFTLFNF